jgi:tetratricopeptide (TPR) repeat protein
VGHGLIDDVDRARDAVERNAWVEAYERFVAADPSHLTSEDLERFANAAWWLSRFEEADALWQRSYTAYAAAGNHPAAAYVSVRLCFEHMFRDEPSVGMGWLMRAQRHLDDQPECFQHGFLALGRSAVAANTGAPDEALALAVRATEIGQRFGHRDLIALGIHGQGLALIADGHVLRGMALLDEAMTAVVAGELSAHYTGVIFCNVLDVCLDLADIARAGEWNDAAKRWCESLPQEAPFPGICRVNRATVAGMRGAWPEAEAEASRASQELTFKPSAAGKAFYETGEIRRRIGNVAGAEEAFARAHELGVEPQPGLGLLRLDQGKTATAQTSLRRAVDGEPGPTPRRSRLLAALVEAAVAAGDLDTA